MPFRAIPLLVSMFLAMSRSPLLFTAEWYVDASVTGSGNGETWGTAFKTIQEGIDTASDDDAIIVAEGIYPENIELKGKNIVLTSRNPIDPVVVGNTVIRPGKQGGPIVTFLGTENEACVLSGFTVQNGRADCGGGICGGTYSSHARAAIRNNVITSNSGGYGAGIAYCDGIIENNIISGNSYYDAPGWLPSGGGLFGCNGTIRGNTISGNTAWGGGGLALCHGVIQNNTISGNTAKWGGGLSFCAGTIQNNVISQNRATAGSPNMGAGMIGCSGIVRNNTIVGNSASGTGGGLVACYGTIQNCIIWGNTAATASQLHNSSVPAYSCIQGGTAGGEGNIDSNPGFLDDAGDDYRLGDGSPCIDAGKNKGWMWQAVDLDGAPRILLGESSLRVDMGAYEFLPPPWGVVRTWYVDGSASESGDGTSPETAKKTIQEGMDAAFEGDVVLVAPYVYSESINFEGKNIVLRSADSQGRKAVSTTVIDGGGTASVVTFAGTENETCLLSGFTIRNGDSENGGGIHGGSGKTRTSARIENNLIVDNVASQNGGGMYGCRGPILNNTISRNSARSEGSGLSYCDGAISNCIVWGNTGSPQIDGRSSTPSYSCIEGWSHGGGGNTVVYPHFVDSVSSDYHLESWSPCVDAGDPAAGFSEEGEPNGRRVNIGAFGNSPEAASKSVDSDADQLPDDWERRFFGYLAPRSADDVDGDVAPNLEEYRRGSDPTVAEPPVPPTHWHVDDSVDASGDGRSLDTAFKTIQEGIDAASHGDIVTVAQGTYGEAIHFKGKNIAVRSTDPLDQSTIASTIIDAGGAGAAVTFAGTENETCVLAGFTITNGQEEKGGGICGGTLVSHAHTMIRDNVITGNVAEFGGGLAYCDGIIENNTIAHNSSAYGGGALYLCNGPIQGNAVTGNSATSQQAFGGALSYCGGAIRNNLIAENAATTPMSAGGGLALCDGAIENNTIVDNPAAFGGGAAFCFGMIRNCIFWGNTAGEDPAIHGSRSAVYSCIQSAIAGPGNIFANPQFDSPDYRLSRGSLCIDGGSSGDWMWKGIDLDGNPRIWGSSVDMGAYEYGSYPFEIVGAVKPAAGGAVLTWSSRLGDTYIVWSASGLSGKSPWTTREATIPSEGGTTSWTDPDTESTQKFYRIGIE